MLELKGFILLLAYKGWKTFVFIFLIPLQEHFLEFVYQVCKRFVMKEINLVQGDSSEVFIKYHFVRVLPPLPKYLGSTIVFKKLVH